MSLEPPAARDPGRRQVLTAPRRARRASWAVALVAACLSGCAGSDGRTDGADDAAATSVLTPTDSTSTDSSNPPATADPPSAATEPTVPGPAIAPEGFTTITAVITSAEGDVCEVCLWLADTAAERGRGLMGVTDLGAAAGMAFRFDDPTEGSFYMFQTPTPLSIAWFGEDGAWVGAEEMEPCLDTPAGECPLYSPGAPYVLAVEAFAGGLEPLGVGPGSRLELVPASESDVCALVAS